MKCPATPARGLLSIQQYLLWRESITMPKWTHVIPVRRLCRLMILLLAVSVTFILLQFHSAWLMSSVLHLPTLVKTTSSSNVSHCPRMPKGRWVPRYVSQKESTDLKFFMEAIRSQYFLPQNMQRKDGKCGNVSFATGFHQEDDTLRLFRGTCDPDGPTPCCRQGTCTDRLTQDCVCSTCFDLRQDIQADLASWKPDVTNCGVREWTREKACRLLAGARVIVAGDSVMRQLYVAMIILLTGNSHDGALRTNITEDIRLRCFGIYQFLGKECRQLIVKDITVCSGGVRLSFKPCPRVIHMKHFVTSIKSLAHQSRSLVLLSLGQHDAFNIPLVKNNFLHPVLGYMNASKLKWPMLIWLSIHAFGTLSFVQERSKSVVEKYNLEMREMLEQWNIPVLDTYSLTQGVASPDGVHYGQGVNIAKTNLVLTFLYEQKLSHKW